MRGVRLFGVLVLLALGAAAIWFVRGQNGQSRTGPAEEAPQAAYDYEAHDVVLRQMGPDGRLAFQIEAKEITQLPANGRVNAKGLTLYQDPAGTVVGGPNRWTLTADSGELPAEGGVVTLTGNVRAHGIPEGKRTQMNIATESLRYDMTTQELSSDEFVQLTMGGFRAQGRGVTANLRTGEVKIDGLEGELKMEAPARDADAP